MYILDNRGDSSQAPKRRRRAEESALLQQAEQNRIEESQAAVRREAYESRNPLTSTVRSFEDNDRYAYEDDHHPRKKKKKGHPGLLITLIVILLLMNITLILGWVVFPQQKDELIWNIWPTPTPTALETPIPTSTPMPTPIITPIRVVPVVPAETSSDKSDETKTFSYYEVSKNVDAISYAEYGAINGIISSIVTKEYGYAEYLVKDGTNTWFVVFEPDDYVVNFKINDYVRFKGIVAGKVFLSSGTYIQFRAGSGSIIEKESVTKEPLQTEIPSFSTNSTSVVSNQSVRFSNKYGTPTTICAHRGCNNYIATSGDTSYCTMHSKKCLECGKYIDEDATYCMDCLKKAAESVISTSSLKCHFCSKSATKILVLSDPNGNTEGYRLCQSHYDEYKRMANSMPGWSAQ